MTRCQCVPPTLSLSGVIPGSSTQARPHEVVPDSFQAAASPGAVLVADWAIRDHSGAPALQHFGVTAEDDEWRF